MPSQYAVTVRVRRCGRIWVAESDEMPGMKLTNADPGPLLHEAYIAFAHVYDGENATLTVVVPGAVDVGMFGWAN